MDAKHLKSNNSMKMNHYWVIEKKNSSGFFIPVDGGRTRRFAREMLSIYKDYNEGCVYRIRKYLAHWYN